MAITIANMIAQIGTDVTQFRIGMNEVEARLHLVAVREREAGVRVQQLRDKQMAYAQEADRTRAFRTGRIQPQLATVDAQLQKDTRELVKADLKLQTAGRNLTRAVTASQAAAASGSQTAMDAASASMKKYSAEVKTAQSEVSKLNAAVKTGQAKSTSLNDGILASRLKEARQRMASAEAGRRSIAYDEEGQALREVARRYAARLAQNANEHRIRAANAIAAGSEKAGLAIGGVLAVGDKIGNDFNQKMVQSSHNTSLDMAGKTEMSRAVKDMGAESGASLDGLIDGYRKIENYGYKAAEATKILGTSMKASVAYGSDLAETTDLLVKELKEFSIPADMADQAMNIMVQTAKTSSQTMGELTHVYGNMSAYSANLGVSLLETSAAFITLTRHGLNASDAATQFKNDINRIINPAAKVQTALANITKDTGVNLTRDFSETGLKVRKMTGIWEDFAKAAEKYRAKGGIYKNVTAQDIAAKAFPMQRGQLGAVISTGTGFGDWHKAMDELRKSAANGEALNKDYKESLMQVNQQLDRLKNMGIIAAASISTALAPSIKEAVDFVMGYVDAFNRLSESQKSGIIKLVAVGAAMLITVGIVGKLIVGIVALNNAIVAIGVTQGIFGAVKLGITGLGAAFAGMTVVTGATIVAFVAIGATLAYIIYQMDRASHYQEELRKQLEDTTAERLRSTKADYEGSSKLDALITRYHQLSEQAAETHKPVKGMQETLDRIAALAPELVSGFDREGHAISLIGSAADATSKKLANMAAQARAAAIMANKLDEAHIREQRNSIAAQLASEEGFNMPGRPGGPSIPLSPNAADHQRALRNQLMPLDKKLADMAKHDEDMFRMPTNVGEARHRSTEMLTQDLTIMSDKLNEATNKLVEFDRANIGGNPNIERRGKILDEVEAVKKRVKVFQDELAARKKVADSLDPFGINGRPGTPGDDPLAHIYDKPKKPKKEKAHKKTDAEKLDEEYEQFIERLRAKQYEALNINEDKTNTNAVKAKWETISHGMLTVSGVAKELKGSFFDLGDSYKKVVVDAGKADDAVDRFLDTQRKLKDLQKTNDDKRIEGITDLNGQHWTPMQTEQYKYNRGDYHKEYGSHAKEAFDSNMQSMRDNLQGRYENAERKFGQDHAETPNDPLAVYHKTLDELRSDTELYNYIGEDTAKMWAKGAQRVADLTERTVTYDDQLRDLGRSLAELKLEDKEFGASREELKRLELTGREYNKLTAAEKENIVQKSKELDIQEKLNKAHAASRELTKTLKEEVDKSRTLVTAAKDPVKARWEDFHQNAIDRLGESYKTMSPDDKNAAEQQIAEAFKQIEANNKQAEQLEKVAQTMKEVKKGTEDLTTVWKVNTHGVQISTKEWSQLSQAQQDAVNQFSKLAEAKDKVKDALDAIDGFIGKTLDNLQSNGFKGFFSSIVQDFDKMLSDLAKKWIESEFVKIVNNGLSGLLGGALGVPGGAGGGPEDLFKMLPQGGRAAAPGPSPLGGIFGSGGIFGDIFGGGLHMPSLDPGFTPGIAGDLFGGDQGASGLLGSLFGGDMPGGSGSASDIFGGFFANGGDMMGDRSYMVGENGPELFTPKTSGNMTSNKDLGGDTHVTVHINGVQNPSAWRDSDHQIAQTVGRAIAATQRR